MIVVFTKRRYYKGSWREIGEEVEMPKVYYDAYSAMGAVKLHTPTSAHPMISSIETNEKTKDEKETEDNLNDLEDMTVKELKEIAKDKGVATYGTKQQIVDRINEVL